MDKLKIIMVLMLIASSVDAYVPVKFINGGSYKCMDNASECGKEGYYFNKITGKQQAISNKNTSTWLFLGVISAMSVMLLFKVAGGGGRICVIQS